jgi:hypothetical protein
MPLQRLNGGVFMKSFSIAAAAVLALSSSAAHTTPGLDEKVYGATVEKGVSEVELRYGRLVGGVAGGENATVVELSHGFSDRLYAGVLLGFEREPGNSRHFQAVGAEGIVTLGHINAIDTDVAIYGEYEAERHGADNLETKLLLQHRRATFDGRLNLIAEKQLEGGSSVEFGYGASADWKLIGDLRGGVEAFGELGSTRHLFPRAEHFVGPILKTELEHLPGRGELGIEAGYLFAVGAARDEAKGQARLLLEYEFDF